jgi:hypothetical protein
MLNYPLFEGRFINRWLITGVCEEPVIFAPVVLNGTTTNCSKQDWPISITPINL